MDKSKDDEENHQMFSEVDPLRSEVNAPDDFEADAEKNRSCGQSFRNVLNNVTIEPVIFLMIFPSLIGMMASQNLSLQKACRVNLNFTEEICNSLTNKDMIEYEAQVQKLAAVTMSYKTYLTATLPSIVALLVGSYSDRTGKRKVFLITPVLGQLILNITSLTNVYFFHQLNLQVLVFSEGIIESLSGGWCVLFVTCFSYIGVITNEQNRTYRLGLVNFCMSVAFPIGIGLSGVLLKKYGFYGTYGVTATCALINLLYILIFVKDPPKTKSQLEAKEGCLYFVKTFFDLSNFRETIKVVFKNGPNHRRLRICILLSVVTLLFGPMYGEISVTYLSTRYRFNWDELKYSFFQTYNFVLHTIGTIFSILVFSKLLGWHDATLGIISTISKIASACIYCFASNQYIFLLAPVADTLNGTALIAMRSIMSKLVESNELGKLNSIVGLTENLMPLVYVPLYTHVYLATMEFLPGLIFLMGATMTLPAVAVFIWLLVEHRIKERKAKLRNAVL